MTTLVPTRLLVLQRLCDHLGTLVADIGGTPEALVGRVFRGRNLFGEETRECLPIIAVVEAPRPDAGVGYASDWSELRDEMWTLLVQGRISDNAILPSDKAYWLCAAVEQHLLRISSTDRDSGDPTHPSVFNLGGLICELQIAPPVVRPPEDKVSSTAFFFLPIRVRLVTQSSSIYTAV